MATNSNRTDPGTSSASFRPEAVPLISTNSVNNNRQQENGANSTDQTTTVIDMGGNPVSSRDIPPGNQPYDVILWCNTVM